MGSDKGDIGPQTRYKHLLDLGRRNIAYIGRKEHRSPEHAARYAGYARALREAGIEADENLRFPADNSEVLGCEAMQQLLARGRPIDAMFAVTDLIAIGAMRAIKDAGLRIPDDIAVVGFDDMPLASYVTPALTTVQQNPQVAAEGLVQGIVALIEGKPVASTLMEPYRNETDHDG